MSLEVSLQGMQIPARHIHTIRGFRRIEQSKLPSQFRGMHWLDSCLAPGQEELLETGMPEGLNHDRNVARSAPRVKDLSDSLVPGRCYTMARSLTVRY